MIYVNHSKRAIFIHIPKTGGTYITTALTTKYGFTRCYMAQRRPDHASVCPPSDTITTTGNAIYDRSFFNHRYGLVPYCRSSPELLKQMGITAEQWDSYTKYCFVRNPYTRAIANWKHFYISIYRQRGPSLAEYMSMPAHSHPDVEYGHMFMNQLDHIRDYRGVQYGLGVNVIGRFEHLERDFCAMLRRMGFPGPYQHDRTPRNVSQDKPIDPRMSVLTPATIARINELFRDDFVNLGYKRKQ